MREYLIGYTIYVQTNNQTYENSFSQSLYRDRRKSLYLVVRYCFLLLLNCSAWPWPCLGPAYQYLHTFQPISLNVLIDVFSSASTVAPNVSSNTAQATTTTSAMVTSPSSASAVPSKSSLQDKPESLPYQCMECAREFADVPSLKSHRLEHLKERPFK